MNGSLLQLLYKPEYNYTLNSPIYFNFKFVYKKYADFYIHNKIHNSDHFNNFGLVNSFNLKSDCHFIKNLYFKIKLFGLETKYEKSSLQYIQLLKTDNLFLEYDNFINNYNLTILNNYLNVINDKYSSYPFYLNDEILNTIDSSFNNYYSNYYYQLNQYFISNDDLTSNLLKLNDFQDNIDSFDEISNTKKVIFYETKIINNTKIDLKNDILSFFIETKILII